MRHGSPHVITDRLFEGTRRLYLTTKGTRSRATGCPIARVGNSGEPHGPPPSPLLFQGRGLWALEAAALEPSVDSYRQRERAFGRTSEQLKEGEPVIQAG